MSSEKVNSKKEETSKTPPTSPGGSSGSSFKFYGQADHKNVGIFSSILMRKGRKVTMTEDCKALCKNLEAYKLSSDKMHKALMFLLVENLSLSSKLGVLEPPSVIEMDRPYKNLSEYLAKFDKIQKKGRKGTYDSLEPPMKCLDNITSDTDKYVKKQLKVLKPLTNFIGNEYWEYARLRRIYWDSLESYDAALTQQSKERTPEAEQATQVAQTIRNEQKAKMVDYINKLNNDGRPKHAECVVKFAEEASHYHSKVFDILREIDANEITSVMAGKK